MKTTVYQGSSSVFNRDRDNTFYILEEDGSEDGRTLAVVDVTLGVEAAKAVARALGATEINVEEVYA